jgi:hypothetical protein
MAQVCHRKGTETHIYGLRSLDLVPTVPTGLPLTKERHFYASQATPSSFA